ncbi:MAG: TraR/DksA C4-type zinc finger protein [Gammaproteobacteria bacterium]|jgi:DnaK suppressor protein
MVDGLTTARIKEFKQLLEKRREDLLEAIRNELLQSDNEQYLELAGRVHDVADEGSADLLADLSLASIDQHIEEIRDIEAALLRIASLSYGICEDCSTPISVERLKAYPTARRCHQCQQVYERTHVQKGQPRL